MYGKSLKDADIVGRFTQRIWRSLTYNEIAVEVDLLNADVPLE